MSTAIRYLRLYLHRPAARGGGRRAIGYLSQYGDILRVSFARIDGNSTAEQESGHRHDDEIRDRNANVHDGLRGKPRCRAAQAPDSPCALYL